MTTAEYDTDGVPPLMEDGYDVYTAADEQEVYFAPNLFKWNGGEMIFLVILFVFGLVGNMMVMYIYHFKWRRSNFTLFIEVLAAIDLTNCLVSMTLLFVLTLYKSELFDVLCGTASYTAFATALSSGIVLVIIAFERKQKIRNPLKLSVSTSTTKKLCGGAVLVGMAVSAPGTTLYGRKTTVFLDEGVAFNLTWCFIKEDAFHGWYMYIWAAVLGVLFLFVIFSLSSLYCSIWRELHSHFKGKGSLDHFDGPANVQIKNNNYYRANKSSARIFFLITLTFFVTYFPYFIALGILFFNNDNSKFISPVGKVFMDLAKLSPLMSNVINPIIYSMSSARFRTEIVNIFKGLSAPNRNNAPINHVANTFVKHSQSVTCAEEVKIISTPQVITDVARENNVIKLSLT